MFLDQPGQTIHLFSRDHFIGIRPLSEAFLKDSNARKSGEGEHLYFHLLVYDYMYMDLNLVFSYFLRGSKVANFHMYGFSVLQPRCALRLKRDVNL